MRTSRVIGAVMAAVSVGGVAGCSSGSGHQAAGASTAATTSVAVRVTPAPTSSGSTSSGVAASSALPTTSSGTTAGAAGAPGVPEPARQHTKAGAIAFAEHYIGLINSVGQEPKVGVLEPLALASCKSCDNFEGTIKYFVAHKQRFDGPQYKIKKSNVTGYSEIATFIRVEASEPAVSIVAASGSNVKRYPEVLKSVSIFRLDWRSGWRVVTIQGES